MNPCAVMERRLRRFYAGTALGMAAAMNVYKVYIDGSNWRHLFQLDFYFVTAGMILVCLLLIGFTKIRLRRPHACFAAPADQPEQAAALRDLIRFPAELGVVVFLLGVLLSASYHYMEMAVLQLRMPDAVFARHVLIELAAGLAAAMLFRGLARMYAAPCAARIGKTDMRGLVPSSFAGPWLAAFLSVLAVTGMMLIGYVINMQSAGGIQVFALLALCGMLLLFGAGMVRLLSAGFLSELRVLVEGMRGLRTDHDGGGNFKRIPVTSRDEMGMLAEAFNALQDQIEREYRELSREFELAGALQQRMLPPPDQSFGPFRVVCHSRPAREVGGDLADVLRLSDRHFAFAIGDVSGKGMPAALVMSAVVTLFRSEARRGGSAEQMLGRLNRLLGERLQGAMMVTMGIGICDCAAGTLQYASAGHLAPYLLAEDGVKKWVFSSLPLGIDPAERYRGHRIALSPGDCLVFITDGVVEGRGASGQMYGFEQFERALEDVRSVADPSQKADRLQERIASFNGTENFQMSGPDAQEDDQTLLLIQHAGSGDGDA